MEKSTIKTIVSGVAGLAVGGTIGYFVTKKRLQDAYAEFAAKEIHDAQLRYYELLNPEPSSEGELSDQEMETYFEILSAAGYEGTIEQLREGGVLFGSDVLRDTVSQVQEHQEADISEEEIFLEEVIPEDEPVEEIPEPIAENVNLFEAVKKDLEDQESDAAYEEEVANRDTSRPFVISVSDFMVQQGFQKISMTYFDGDDTLIDDSGQIVPDVERMLTTTALTKFGVFSGDSEFVHVRNPEHKLDIEVYRDMGTYVDKILGISDKNPVQKMREDD